MQILAPNIETRTFRQWLEAARAKALVYTPEWNAMQEKDGAQALLQVYLHLFEHVSRRLNRTPDKHLIAFLHHLGIRLQPAQSARAIVTFTLAEGTIEHVRVPKGTQLAGEGLLDGEEVIFESESELRVTPARLEHVYSTDTVKDALYKHTADLNSDKRFKLFSGTNKQERSLYIGHTELLDQTHPSEIVIDFTMAAGASGGALELVWEYWNGRRWDELQRFPNNTPGTTDSTNLLSQSGQMTFKKESSGEFATLEINGKENRWLRCRLTNDLAALRQIRLPEINSLSLSVTPLKPFPAELAFHNDIPLDLDKSCPEGSATIHPFGQLPRQFDTFYIASDEAFSKRGAEISLDIDSKWHDGDNTDASNGDDDNSDQPKPTLSWEYWNGNSWRLLKIKPAPAATKKFNGIEEIKFTCPEDIQKIEVNGEEKFWIRVRLIDGDYGKEFIIKPETENGNPSTQVVFEKGIVHYPIIKKLCISYKNTLRQPEQCLSLNNLDYIDHLNAIGSATQTFQPYQIIDDRFASFFLGFDKKLEGGPLNILFNLEENPSLQDVKINWFYWNGTRWLLLNATDNSRHLTQIGLLTFAMPNDFQSLELFDKKSFWIKGSVVEGEFLQLPKLFSIRPNSVVTTQAAVVEDESLGVSTAVANQALPLQNGLIMSQEVVVLETTPPSEDERQVIVNQEGTEAIVEQQDDTGDIQLYQIRWHEVDDFDDSGPKDRHYTVDKHGGEIQFGDGINGMIPPPGADNIRVTYRFGGGANGNVEVGKIASLKNAIPFVDQVTNYLRADGGADTETLAEVRARGPQILKHRGRAVSPSDFEALAKNASRIVARAKCLTNTNVVGNPAPGRVSVLIVPTNQTASESPTRILINTVTHYLKMRMSSTISANEGLHVRGADYIGIAVEPTIVPTTLEATAQVEDAVISALKRYIHPLTGGPDGDGWAFGDTLCRTELFALLEGIEGVDHVPDIVIRINDSIQAGDIVMAPDQLPFSQEHKVNIQPPGASVSRVEPQLDSTCQEVPEAVLLDDRLCKGEEGEEGPQESSTHSTPV